MTRVILASASSGRRKVLRQAGIDPLVVVSGVDEDAVTAQLGPQATPDEVTTSLAVAKADAVAASLGADIAADCVVIGCDSMLYRNGALLGKPRTAEGAMRQWRQMAGSEGDLYTGHCVIRLRASAVVHRCSQSSCTTVIFGEPSEVELSAYIQSGEPLGVAGGFTLDGLGGWFVEGVRGDPSGVVGISLPLTRRLLQDTGLSVAELWNANPLPSELS